MMLTAILISILAMPREAAAAPPGAAGTWAGTSTCVGNRPACKNESVVYRFVPIEGSTKLHQLADKVLDGKRVAMGALDFEVSGTHLKSEFQIGTTRGVWELTVGETAMEGTLVILPSGELVRRVSVHRVSDSEVPAPPPMEDYER